MSTGPSRTRSKYHAKPGQFRLDLVGRTITAVVFERDADGSSWTRLTLDTGQMVHILDESPWVWVEPEVM